MPQSLTVGLATSRPFTTSFPAPRLTMWCLFVAGFPQTQQTRASLSMLGLPIIGSRIASTVQTSFDGLRGLRRAGGLG